LAVESGISHAGHFGAGVDEIYFNSPLKRKKEIIIYYQPEKSRRLPGLTIQVAQKLKKNHRHHSVRIIIQN
jgi:hypothetical protein